MLRSNRVGVKAHLEATCGLSRPPHWRPGYENSKVIIIAKGEGDH